MASGGIIGRRRTSDAPATDSNRCTISHQILHHCDVAPPGGEISVEDESNAETPRLGEEKRGEETGLYDGKVTQNPLPSFSFFLFFSATRRPGVQSNPSVKPARKLPTADTI
jgi:hypothetical protein